MNPQASSAGNTSGYAGLGVIATLTFVVYLSFGLYYVTHNAERVHGPGDLGLKDEAYLSAFGTWNAELEADEAFYNRTAITVIQTGVPRRHDGSVTFHAPLYSYFLAACYSVGGLRKMSVAVPQALIAAGLAWWAGLAARRLAPHLGPRVMWLAGGLILVNLSWAKSVGVISPTLLLQLWVALALYAATGPLRWGGALGFAGALALGIFTQAAFFVVAAPAALWLGLLFVQRRQLALGVACVLILISIGMNLVLPAAATQRGKTTRNTKPLVLWEANNPYYESMTLTSLWERRPGNPWTRWRASAEEQQRYDDYLKRAEGTQRNPGVLWIIENPKQYAKLCWIRLYTMLGPFTGQMSPRNRVISTCYWLLIIPAGWYGVWRLRSLPISRLAVLVFLALTAFGTLIIVEWYLRYRLPLDLVLTLYATATYTGLLERHFRQSNAGSPSL